MTTKTKQQIAKPPCVDGTYAHRMRFNSPSEDDGGLVEGHCIHLCGYVQTVRSSFNETYDVYVNRAKANSKTTDEEIDG